MDNPSPPPVITATARVEASPAQVEQWFRALEAHPEQYRFDTHEGFTFIEGQFGQAGARFQTRERFYGLPLRLTFQLTEVSEARFCFRLVRPTLPIWGAFLINEGPEGTTDLRLEIGGETRLGQWLLRLPGVGSAIRRQIQAEVDHIKASVETAQ